MPTETKDRPLSAEDVTRIVEACLDKHENEAKKKRRHDVDVDEADLARLELQAEMIGERCRGCIGSPYKKAEVEAKGTEEEEAKKKKPGFWS